MCDSETREHFERLHASIESLTRDTRDRLKALETRPIFTTWQLLVMAGVLLSASLSAGGLLYSSSNTAGVVRDIAKDFKVHIADDVREHRALDRRVTTLESKQ